MLGNWASTYQHGGEDGISVTKKTARKKEQEQWMREYEEEKDAECNE